MTSRSAVRFTAQTQAWFDEGDLEAEREAAVAAQLVEEQAASAGSRGRGLLRNLVAVGVVVATGLAGYVTWVA